MSITTKGAIEWLERRAEQAPGKGSREAYLLAIAALREKAEREDPNPLTLEELRQMDGEPVYVTVPGKPHRSKWCIVDLTHPQPGLRGIEYSCSIYLTDTNAVKVYRHKPKEVE